MLDTEKNSRQTDFICIENDTKRVIAYKTVTSEDDKIAQRHKKLGTVDIIYSTLGSDNVAVKMYGHDNNARFGNIREDSNQPQTTSCKVGMT